MAEVYTCTFHKKYNSMSLQQHRYSLFIINVFKHFMANHGIRNAAALTYTTLFVVVPLMTVTYAMLAAIPSMQGAGDGLQAWIFDNFVPSTGEVVQSYLSVFAAQAKSPTGVGIAILILTSIMMMKTIESAFNFIWRVHEPRKGLSSFLLYWAVLSLGHQLLYHVFVIDFECYRASGAATRFRISPCDDVLYGVYLVVYGSS